jgi:hypothetical protein
MLSKADALLQQEAEDGRTLLHYGSIGKSRKAILMLKYMLSYDPFEGYSLFESAFD